eukprot:1527627-Rhodomonas_salina.1
MQVETDTREARDMTPATLSHTESGSLQTTDPRTGTSPRASALSARKPGRLSPLACAARARTSYLSPVA